VVTESIANSFLQKTEELYIDFMKNLFASVGAKEVVKALGKTVEETKQNLDACCDELVRRKAHALRIIEN